MPRKKVEVSQVIVTARDDAPKDRSILKTPEGQPDVQVLISRWWVQVLVRAARTYTQSLIGFIGTFESPIGNAVPLALGAFSQRLLLAASLAAAPAIMSLLMNAGEILGRFDTSNPKLRA